MGITPVWWQRILVVAVAWALAFTFSACLSLVGATYFFVAILCTIPGLFVAHALVFMTIQPKYVRKREPVMNLFQR